MKAITLLSCTLALMLPQLSFADQRVLVPGHQNPDGTYTAPYVTVVPDGTTATTSTDTNVVVTPQSTGTVVINPNNQLNAVGVVQGGVVQGRALDGYRGGVNGAAGAAAVHGTNGQLQRGNLDEGYHGVGGAGRENGFGREGHGGGERRRQRMRMQQAIYGLLKFEQFEDLKRGIEMGSEADIDLVPVSEKIIAATGE